MKKIKIGVVEDELIIADDIVALLTEMDYDTAEPCGNFEDAINMLNNDKPDLAILDVNLGDKLDGVDIARYIRTHLNIPFIFLTANSDAATVKRARETMPNAYLVKPFQKADIYTAIEVALYNFDHSKNNPPIKKDATNNQQRDYIFIKEGDYFHKVTHDEILYLSSEHIYVTVHTARKKFLIRTSMQEYIETLGADKFVRVHRSYAINLDKIDKINTATLLVGTQEIPVSKNYRDVLMRMLNIF